MEKEEQESTWHAYHLRTATEVLPLKTEKTTEKLEIGRASCRERV